MISPTRRTHCNVVGSRPSNCVLFQSIFVRLISSRRICAGDSSDSTIRTSGGCGMYFPLWSQCIAEDVQPSRGGCLFSYLLDVSRRRIRRLDPLHPRQTVPEFIQAVE